MIEDLEFRKVIEINGLGILEMGAGWQGACKVLMSVEGNKQRDHVRDLLANARRK